MLLIGIDPATSCGWAVLEGERRVSSGTWDLAPKRHQGGGWRYLLLRRHLEELLEAYPADALAYEQVERHAGTTAAHVYGGLIAMIAVVCEERGLPYRGIPVGTVKRIATGKGRADKAQMVASAAKRWGITPATDDEADALFVALALSDELGLARGTG